MLHLLKTGYTTTASVLWTTATASVICTSRQAQQDILQSTSTPSAGLAMGHILTYQSSEIDWCEGNFQHSLHVAEFYNTISNVTFFIVAPLMMYLMHPYARERTWAVHLFWPMLMVVGIFSAYYHMTLSYLGQLLDEISILWILAVGYSIWFPRPHFPSFIKTRRQFASAVSITACISTLMSFAKPTVNAYVLNCVTFHIIYVLVLEMKKCSLPQIQRLAFMSVCLWLLAISCWLSDRLLCGFWRRINFCYLHSFWHVLISITVVHSITLFAYFDAIYEIPHCQPEIQYWPCSRWQLGLPYLAVYRNQKPRKSC